MRQTLPSKKLKVLLAGLIVIVLCAVASVFMGYRRMMDKAQSPFKDFKKGASMSISTVRQTATRDGITEWSLNAASASLTDGKKHAGFEKPQVTFFIKDQGNVLLTANEGHVFTESNDIQVNGDVVIKNEAYMLKTQSLKYQHAKRMFISDSPVKITGETFDLTADTASFDLNGRKAVFKGNVEGVFGEDLSL